MKYTDIKIIKEQMTDSIKYELVYSFHTIDGIGIVPEYGFIVSDTSKSGAPNCAQALFVTPDKITAEQILTMLTENNVEPCHLEDIINDIL